MNPNEIIKLLEAFRNGKIETEELLDILKSGGFTDLGHTKVDTSRLFRTGYPEVVFCLNKDPEDVLEIAEEIHRRNKIVLLTKVSAKHHNALKGRFRNLRYHEKAGIITIGKAIEKRGSVSVLTGGTSDINVAEEAAVTAELFGCNVKRFYDVGIAGLHRLLSFQREIGQSNVIVAVAGMEGALPSVVGGLFGIPVIGVPTSVGYGTSFKGVTPLLTMLNSCAPGIAVVNIDNGFGAGYIASTINKMIEDARNNG